MVREIVVYRPVHILLTVGMVFLSLGVVVAQSPTSTPAGDAAAMVARLEQVPIFENFDSPHLVEIFRLGQRLGNRADVFTTVGDSNTTNGDFLRPIGREPNDCEFGGYEALWETVEHFSVAPRPNQRNSFTNDSAAAEMGFSTSSVLDPFWAEPTLCERNENPLSCEYRLVKPSVAIILLGQIDINYGGPAPVEQFRANMERIAQTSLEQGIIPVLNTIVFLPERDVWSLSMEYNMAVLDIVEQYDIPLINLWRAVQSLPASGIGPDRSHLRAVVGKFCSFDGSETEIGGTLRNLLTLQALDMLRRTVLDPLDG